MDGPAPGGAGPEVGASPAQGEEAGAPRLGALLGLAAVVGVLASAAAVLFVAVEHQLQHLLWAELPDWFGWEQPAAWWVVAALIAGALLVWAATHMPGHGGHHPLGSFVLDIGPREIASALLAALGSLAFGAVLGPEAPLLAIGTAMAASIYRGPDMAERQILMAAGAMAAMGNIFGNPLVTSILILEVVVLKGGRGGRSAVFTLLPGLVALGFGYLLQVGVGSWGGFGESVLAVPGLPEYPSVVTRDLLVAPVLALVIGLLISLAVLLAKAYQDRSEARPLPSLVVAAALIAGLALAVRWGTDLPVEAVLFSGQSAIPELLTLTSIGTLLAVALAKAAAYGISLGAGFRGGAVFPAVFVGITLGVATALLVDETSMSAFVAAGIAAGAGAAMRLPFTSVLLAVALCEEAGNSVTSVAIIAAVVGLLVRGTIDAVAGRAAARVDAPVAS